MYKRLFIAFILTAIAFLSVLVIPSLATPSTAIAQKPTINCSQATTTPELKYCSQQSYAAADKKLNQTYQKVLVNIQREPKQLLTKGQQAWIVFRDNACDFEVYESRGGTGYEIFRNQCLERLTKQRTQDLENYLQLRAR
ncbi:lysozyme inhibitor LprI family protein [Pelatocladus sp. BLCC-F211]|uniref:lysozyme inhibitor LprI family protein n=1 Tax=Pelatocladus sp. BLCC-F211 TaxID=3342752 RepID=UPI0035B927A6